MYDVNGFPSMVMSTRRCGSSATTRTPFPDGAAKTNPAGRQHANNKQSMILLSKDLASCDDLLSLVVERDFFSGLDCSNVHAECDGVAVACFDWGVRSFARAHAFHPVAHVGRGLGIAAGVGPAGNGLGFLY